jgi:hypothetical protein
MRRLRLARAAPRRRTAARPRRRRCRPTRAAPGAELSNVCYQTYNLFQRVTHAVAHLLSRGTSRVAVTVALHARGALAASRARPEVVLQHGNSGP